MSKINGALGDHIVLALHKSIRGQEAFDSVKRMVEAIDTRAVAIVDAEMFCPAAENGERTFTFRFHLKAVD
jgi:hypothetical protein